MKAVFCSMKPHLIPEISYLKKEKNEEETLRSEDYFVFYNKGRENKSRFFSIQPYLIPEISYQKKRKTKRKRHH